MPAWANALRSTADVRAVLDQVNRDGLTRANTTALAEAIRPAGDVELAPDASKLLPAPPQLADLLPWPGLRRGATIAVTGSHTVLMLLLAAAMSDGSWAAVVGMPAFGVLAAHEAGVPVDRLALVPDPGPDWPKVVAALIDGVDVVVMAAPPGVPESTVNSLRARARERGAVLVATQTWPGVDVTINATSRRWHGLECGRGRLRYQQLELTANGRGKAARPRTGTITVPEPPAPIRIPPPLAEVTADHPTQTAAKVDLWAHLEANNPPADAWADLQQAVPQPGPRKR